MAASSTFNTSNQYIKYKITVTEGSVNVADNTSPVTVKVNVYRTNTGYETYGTGTLYCKINGITYSSPITSSQKITSTGVDLFAKTVTVPHDADGSKTLAVSAWIQHSQVTSSEQGFNVTLTTIPRATTPTLSATSAYMGGAITISMPRASSTFTHTLKYKFVNASGTIGSSLGTSYSWTIPLSLASQLPNVTGAYCTITCETYSGDILIGSKSVTLLLQIPASVVPTITAVTIIEAKATTDVDAKFGAFVQNKSTLAVGITAAGAYGSEIVSYETYIQGIPYRERSFTSGLITASGTVGVVTTVTDSRGRTAKVSKSVTVLPYVAPTIELLKCWRIDTSGAASDDGERLAMQMKFSISSVDGKNDRTYAFKYKLSTDTEFTTFASGTASTTYDDTQFLTSAPVLSVDNAYTIRLEISDFFETKFADFDLPSSFTLINFRSTGKGIEFGGASNEDVFGVSMDAKFRKQVHIYAPTSSDADGGYLRFRRADNSLAAFLATSDNGDGLNLHLYQDGAWSGLIKILPDGSVQAGTFDTKTAEALVSKVLNTSNGYFKMKSGLVVQWGTASITPLANVATYADITFPNAYTQPPFCAANIDGTTSAFEACTNITTQGCRLYVTRPNTTAIPVKWLAIGG